MMTVRTRPANSATASPVLATIAAHCTAETGFGQRWGTVASSASAAAGTGWGARLKLGT